VGLIGDRAILMLLVAVCVEKYLEHMTCAYSRSQEGVPDSFSSPLQLLCDDTAACDCHPRRDDASSSLHPSSSFLPPSLPLPSAGISSVADSSPPIFFLPLFPSLAAEHDLLTERSDYDNSEMISATPRGRRQVSWREDRYDGKLDRGSYTGSTTRDSQDTWDVHEREDTTVSGFLLSSFIHACWWLCDVGVEILILILILNPPSLTTGLLLSVSPPPSVSLMARVAARDSRLSPPRLRTRFLFCLT